MPVDTLAPIAIPSPLDALPEPARRYLSHALGEGVGVVETVELEMHGQIKLGAWRPFKAHQEIQKRLGMIWKAETRLFGLPVRGFDRVWHGYGMSEWRLLGFIPMMFAHGRNISRSGLGRMAAETIWIPSRLLESDVRWKQTGPDSASFEIDLFGETTVVNLTLAPSGKIETISFLRWGKPTGLPFGEYPFGGYVDEEATFDGFTIPSRLRMGWHFGTDRFVSEGEFFRATIDRAAFSADRRIG